MKRILCLLILLLASLALNQTAHAQEFLYSISHVEQFGDPADPNSVMAGYAVTGTTYGLAEWYDSLNVGTLTRDGQIVSQQATANFPNTVSFTQAPLVAGSVYQQFSDTGVSIVFPFVCGTWYDAYGLSAYAYLPHDTSNQWPPLPAICWATQIVYIGYTVAQQTATQANPPCIDTCASCKRDQRNRYFLCAIIGGGCGVAAYTAYEIGINDCENQAICNPTSPMFNQQMCDNCMENKRLLFLSALTACGTAGATCLLTGIPDCSTKTKCVNGQPQQCN